MEDMLCVFVCVIFVVVTWSVVTSAVVTFVTETIIIVVCVTVIDAKPVFLILHILLCFVAVPSIY